MGPRDRRGSHPPGLGNFLIKVGSRPGIPFQVQLTEVERDIHDTNTLWHTQSRIGVIDVDDGLAS